MIHSGIVEELKSFMSTLTRARKRRKLYLRQRRPLGVHEEVVKERHLLFHLLNFVAVFVQDVFPDKLWALQVYLKWTRCCINIYIGDYKTVRKRI